MFEIKPWENQNLEVKIVELTRTKINEYKFLSAFISYYAQKLIVVRIFRVNLKQLTSKFWFSLALISKILV